MSTTFLFSMFMSNTAITAMMISIAGPIVATCRKENGFGKAILLGIAIAANIGGMATVIGTPPNAIAAGLLDGVSSVNFIEWMYAGLPIAVLLLIFFWVYLSYRYALTTAFGVSNLT